MKPLNEYSYRYPRPAVTADCVIFGFDGEKLQLLLVERGLEPYKGFWALPGGFMKMDESIEECALRELREETNVSDVFIEQFKVFSDPDRDPRGRVMTVAFIALVRPSDYHVVGGDDANIAAWFDTDRLPPLAFDHRIIIREAKEKLKELLKVRPLAFRLLNETFTADELRKVYEAVTGKSYDRRNFTRKLVQSGIVAEALVHEPYRRNSKFFSLNLEIIADIAPQYNTNCNYIDKCQNESKRDESETDGSIKDLFSF